MGEFVIPAIGGAIGASLASFAGVGAAWIGVGFGAGVGGLVEHVMRAHLGPLRSATPRVFRGKWRAMGIALGIVVAVAFIVAIEGVTGRASSLLPTTTAAGGQIEGGAITRVALLGGSGEFSDTTVATGLSEAVVRTRFSNQTIDGAPLTECRVKIALRNTSPQRVDGTTIVRCEDANPRETVAFFHIESPVGTDMLVEYARDSTTFWDATISAGGTGEMLARLPDGVVEEGVAIPPIPGVPKRLIGTGRATSTTRFMNFRIRVSVVPEGTMHDLRAADTE